MLGRPPKWKGWKITSLMLLEEYKDVYEAAKKLAIREGIPFSLLVAKALLEYVKAHAPRNPQLGMDPDGGEPEPPLRERVKLEAWKRQLSSLLTRLEKYLSLDPNSVACHQALTRLIALTNKTPRFLDSEARNLLEQARILLDGGV